MNEENLKPWPKGVSGNPGGRGSPRAEFWRQFRDAIAEIEIVLKDKAGKPLKRLPCVEALTRKLVKWAMAEVKFKGKETGSPQNPQMVKLFFDKALGTEVVLSSEATPTGEPQVLNIAELLKDSGLSEAQIKVYRKKAIAMAFPGRGFGEEEEAGE